MKFIVKKRIEYLECYYIEAESAEEAEDKIDDVGGFICDEELIETIVEDLTEEQWRLLFDT